MPSRKRFFASSPLTRKQLRTISDVLSGIEYSENVPWGFLDIRNTGDTVEGIFVERFETEEEVSNPLGDTIVYKRVRYNQSEFRLNIAIPQLEVSNGSRSTAPLLTEISKSLPDSIAFSSIAIDLQKFITVLKRKTSSMTLLAANLQDISLAADVFARVAVVGSSEVSAYLETVSFGRNTTLEKILLQGYGQLGTFKIEVTSDGRTVVHYGETEKLAHALRSVVRESLRN